MRDDPWAENDQDEADEMNSRAGQLEGWGQARGRADVARGWREGWGRRGGLRAGHARGRGDACGVKVSVHMG